MKFRRIRSEVMSESLTASSSVDENIPSDWEYVQFFYEKHYAKAEKLLDVCNTIKNWAITLWIASVGFQLSTAGKGVRGLQLLPVLVVAIFYIVETLWRTVFRFHADEAEKCEVLLAEIHRTGRMENQELTLGFYRYQSSLSFLDKLRNMRIAAFHETSVVVYFLMFALAIVEILIT